MKNFKNYLACLTAFTLIFTSCSKDETSSVDPGEKATLSFGAIVNDLATKASGKQSISDLPDCSDDAAAYVEIVLLENGTAVVGTTADPYRVDLVPGQIFTEEDSELELEPGTYTLDHFSVYNEAGDLLWLAPKGGMLGDFIDNPLPLDISLGAGVKKYVDVPVLCYDNRDVNEYGYQFFELDASQWFKFCFFANYCTPEGRHYPAKYSVDISVDGEPLYTGVENVVGTNEDGDSFAEPLCFALPNIEDYADDFEYIEYTVTLLDWEGVYDAQDGQVISGSLSRDDIEANFDGADNVDYEHLRFNCGPVEGECVPGTPTPGDADGDCIPDGEDPCPQVPADQDRDGDCIPDNEDPCPTVPADLDRDGDCIPDSEDPCPQVPADQDRDGDCIPDNEDPCPTVPTNQDRDGDCIPDNEDECPDDVNNECEVLEGCETAYMVGDNKLNELGYKGNNWGWAEYYNNEGNDQYPIYAGAGQNDIDRGTLVGYVTLTAVGNTYTIDVDYFDGVDVNDFHVYIGDDLPASRAPGQFDNQNDSMTYTFTDADGMFWFIVHAEVCPSSGN